MLGFVGLGLAVAGTVFACIPATFIAGVVVLIAAFAVSLVGLFKKNAAKWPSIVGVVLAIVGGAIGTVVTLVIVAANLAGQVVPTTPSDSSSPPATEQPAEPPVSPDPSNPRTDAADEGRPSPEEIATLIEQVIRDGGTTSYDDMPDFWPCMGELLYESNLEDETLWLLIRGAESLGAGQEAAEQVVSDAILTCDPNGEGAWG